MASSGINFNNEIHSINNPQGNGVSVNSTNSGSAGDTVKIIKKIALTKEQINTMYLLGLEPSDPQQVETFLKMSKEDIQKKIDQIPPDKPEIAEQAQPTEKHEHVHNFNIDTDSPEWKNLSEKERLIYVLQSGTKAQYSQEQWEAMDASQKEAAIENFVKSEIIEHVPGFDTINEEEKLDKLSDFLNILNVADANNMSFKDLIQLKRNSPEEFDKIANEYFANNVKINLNKLITEKNEQQVELEYKEFKEYRTEFRNYVKNNKIDLKQKSNKTVVEFEFLEQKLQNNEKLSNFELSMYKALKAQKALNGGSLENIKSGENNIFNDIPSLIKDDKGHIKFSHPKNRQLILAKFEEKLKSCKTDEQKKELFQSFDLVSQQHILSAYTHTEGKDDNKEILKDFFITQYFMATDGESTLKDQFYIATDGLRKIYKQNGGKMTAEGMQVVGDKVKEFKAEPAANAEVTVLEFNDKEFAQVVTNAIGEREDAADVFKISNPLIANSKNITEDMKQFYAQNSVEILKTPEQRQAQADDLGKFKLDAFDKGSKVGLENAAKKDTSINSSENSSRNIIQSPQNNSIQRGHKYTNIENELTFGDNLTPAQAVKLFSRLSSKEQRELLQSLPPQQFEKLPVKVCEHFPELIQPFIDRGKGIEVINTCNVNTAYKTIGLMARGTDNSRKQLAEFASDPRNRALISEITYENLVESGQIVEQDNKKSFRQLT